MSAKILVIDDEPDIVELTRLNLESEGFDVATAETGTEALTSIKEGEQYEILLTDLRLPDIDGIELVQRLKEIAPDSEIIVVTGYGSTEKAIEATKAGAFYFLEKPVEFDELLILIEKALEHKRQSAEIKELREVLTDRTSYFNVIGSSKAMQDIYEVIDSVAESDANILIVGESGTGKELVANAVHYRSLRSKKPFVKINCAALPKELIESELFGHTKGSFTGASGDKIGLIGQANGGSLLLDEISEMPLELQPKLLRVLQERVYFRLGSEKPQEADFRLISATNRNPQKAVQNGYLREDLYYRINTIEIHIPPLRERIEDIPHLAEHFLQQFAEKYNRPAKKLSQSAYEHLFAHQWSGNVRELQNVIERAVLLTKGDIIEVSALSSIPLKTGKTTAPKNFFPSNDTELSLDQLSQLIVSRISTSDLNIMQEDIFRQLEFSLVNAALERTNGNKQAAANLLGLYRARLYGIIKRNESEEFNGRTA
jgi:DNA-binding NtrC family response regulator